MMSNKTCFIVLFIYGLCACQNVLSQKTEAEDNSSTVGYESSSNPPVVPTSTDTPVVPTSTDTPVVPTSTAHPVNISCALYNGKCGDCVANRACYYCQSDGGCSPYTAKGLIPSVDCDLGNMNYLTCNMSFKVLLILFGCAIGLVLLIIVCVCCYCCCKKKRVGLTKDEIKFARQREERKARSEERRKERESRTEEIRRKYGLMKSDNPYERFDA